MPPNVELLTQKFTYLNEFKAPTGPIDEKDIGTPDAHVPRDPAMNRLTGKHPFNAEPPVPMLLESGFITPNHLHIVRNHGPVPKNDWDTHTIEIGGLVNNPITITMDDIIQMESQTLPVTICCAGNRRKEQNMVKPSIGFSWGPAGVGCAYWTGVYLRDLINTFAGGLKPEALHICIEGNDKTAKGPYGTSVTVQRGMNTEYDILVAYKMNGEPLPYDHGYPVRIIVPGCIGGRSVKWLAKIEATLEPSSNPFQDADNKVFPPVVQSAEQATEEKWWPRQEYSVYDLNINSVIATPYHGTKVELDNLNQTIKLQGYAYGGSNRKITRCEITLDDGKTWKMADIHENLKKEADEYAAQAYGVEIEKGTAAYKATRNWVWVFWSLDIPVHELLGIKEICLRCWNDENNSQPSKLSWSLMGMLNNCWYRVKVHLVREPTLHLVFQHPTTLPTDVTLKGIDLPGWMEENENKEEAKPKVASTADADKLKVYTEEEVTKHVTEDDCWIIYDDMVYDCTDFLKDHPGGASSIVLVAGTDTTDEFDAIHSVKAHEMLEKYLIGKLKPSGPETATPPHTPPATPMIEKEVSLSESDDASRKPYFDPRAYKGLILSEKVHLSTTLRKYIFSLPEGCNDKLEIPVGAHLFIKLREDINDRSPKPKMVIRAYTPSYITKNTIEFVIKVYFPFGTIPGGKMTQALDQIRVGETVDFKGPAVHIEYNGNGSFTFHEKKIIQSATHIGMIAGGTGITPMWQMIKALQEDENPPTASLIYCARNKSEIIFFDELAKLQEKLGRDKFCLRYILSDPSGDEDFEHGTGFLAREEIDKYLFKDEEGSRMVFLCGPPPMLDRCCKPLLTEAYGADFVNNDVHTF